MGSGLASSGPDALKLPAVAGLLPRHYFSDPVFRSRLAKPSEEDPAAAVRLWSELFEARLTWADLPWLRSLTKRPLLLRGSATPTTSDEPSTCAVFDLADTFLADPQLLADLHERLLRPPADPVAVRDDPPLARLEPTEPAPDCRSDPVPNLLPFGLIQAGVGRREGVLVAWMANCCGESVVSSCSESRQYVVMQEPRPPRSGTDRRLFLNALLNR